MIRLPAKGPVHVHAGEDNALMITVPLSIEPGHDAERCDSVAKHLMAGDGHGFYFETGEAAFLAKELSGQTWSKLVLINYMTDSVTQTRDIPGPFKFAARATENVLSLVPTKVST